MAAAAVSALRLRLPLLGWAPRPPWLRNQSSSRAAPPGSRLRRSFQGAKLDILAGGARVSLLVALWAVGLSGVFGVLIGLMAGYLGGWVDALFMRLADIQISIPFILLAIALIGALGPSLTNVILVIAITNWVALR